MLRSCLLIFLTAAGITWGYHWWANKILDHETCSATVIVYDGAVRANLELDFMYKLKEKKGIVAVSGTLFRNEAAFGTVRRDVSYTWTENRDTYLFTSAEITKRTPDETLPESLISEVLADFYAYPGKHIHYSILDLGKNGFLFTVGRRPVFYCSR